MIEDTLYAGVDAGLEAVVLSLKIDEWNAHGVLPIRKSWPSCSS